MSTPPAALAAAITAAAAGDITPLAALAATGAPEALDALAGAVNERARTLGYDRAEVRCTAAHPECAAAEAVLSGDAQAAAGLSPALRAQVAAAIAALYVDVDDEPGMAGWPVPLRHRHSAAEPGVMYTLSCPLCGQEGINGVLLGCPGCLQAAVSDAIAHILSHHVDPATYQKLKNAIAAGSN